MRPFDTFLCDFFKLSYVYNVKYEQHRCLLRHSSQSPYNEVYFKNKYMELR